MPPGQQLAGDQRRCQPTHQRSGESITQSSTRSPAGDRPPVGRQAARRRAAERGSRWPRAVGSRPRSELPRLQTCTAASHPAGPPFDAPRRPARRGIAPVTCPSEWIAVRAKTSSRQAGPTPPAGTSGLVAGGSRKVTTPRRQAPGRAAGNTAAARLRRAASAPPWQPHKRSDRRRADPTVARTMGDHSSATGAEQ